MRSFWKLAHPCARLCFFVQLMRQIEKYADVYTSRVSNFLRYSPFQ
jgi:hypothetical protein